MPIKNVTRKKSAMEGKAISPTHPMSHKTMTETQARTIFNTKDLSVISREDCRRADLWMKEYALESLRKKLFDCCTEVQVRNFMMLLARVHYGSYETDEFLRKMKCYPDWL